MTFDHVDVTRLLKDNLKMRYDIDYLKEECVSKRQLEELKLEIENLKKASIVNNFQSKVNYKRGACLVDSFEYDSGPMGLPPAHIEQDISINHHLSSKNVCRYRPIIEGSVESLTPTQTMNVSKSDVDAGSADKPVADRDTCDALMTHDVCLSPEPAPPRHTAGPNQTDLCEIKTLTSSELLPEGESTSEEGKWIPVQNRKRNRFAAKRGSAVVGDSTNFKAAATKVAIYIYNVSKATTVSDIANYVHKKVNIPVTLVKVNMKVLKDYDAYKVFVPKQNIDLFLKNDFWPEGIAFRRFIDFGGTNGGLPGLSSKNTHK